MHMVLLCIVLLWLWLSVPGGFTWCYLPIFQDCFTFTWVIRLYDYALMCCHCNDLCCIIGPIHDDVIKWKHFPRYWPFVQGIHRSPVNSPHKGQWRGALMFSLIFGWINAWVKNHEARDLRCHHTHYDVTVMVMFYLVLLVQSFSHYPFVSFQIPAVRCTATSGVFARSASMASASVSAAARTCVRATVNLFVGQTDSCTLAIVNFTGRHVCRTDISVSTTHGADVLIHQVCIFTLT